MPDVEFHTPEDKAAPTPWRVHVGADYCRIESAESGEGVVETVHLTEADAQRIVECVNACAGMVDPAKAIGEARAELHRLRRALASLRANHRLTPGEEPIERIGRILAALG